MWLFRKSSASGPKPLCPHHLFDVGFHEDPNVLHRRSMEVPSYLQQTLQFFHNRYYGQDKHTIIVPFLGDSNGFFALFDGHGGVDVADRASIKMHEIFQEQLQAQEGEQGIQMKECFEKTYAKMDEVLKGAGSEIGATAVTCFLQKVGSSTQLYSANAGDARAVLCRAGKAIRLTHDHKPNEEEERHRLEDSGGFVARNRVNGILAVSRALGDHCLKKWVISDPFFSEETLTADDQVLVIACDGVWDVLDDQEVADLVLRESSAQRMAEALVEEAMLRGTTDNVSAITVRFCW